jgi:hypothetical protein
MSLNGVVHGDIKFENISDKEDRAGYGGDIAPNNRSMPCRKVDNTCGS